MRIRRTPCIGVCSTTYGDLVCRGCKRYSHEVTGWNGYTEEQRHEIWVRLYRLRDESVRVYVAIDSEERLHDAASQIRLDDDLSVESRVFEVLRRTEFEPQQAGLRPIRLPDAARREDLLAAIEQEFFIRSGAVFERNFRLRHL